MKRGVFILLIIFLFQCKKEQKSFDSVDIVNEYFNNPVFGISDSIYINSDYFLQNTNKESFSVFSFFDKKKIKFQLNSKLKVSDFAKISFIRIDSDSIKKIKDSNSEIYLISEPIISVDKNYALLEAGVFNYKDKGFNRNNIYRLPDIVHVFLYKKINGKWKRLELIAQIRV